MSDLINKLILILTIFIFLLPGYIKSQKKDSSSYYLQFNTTGSYNRTNQFRSFLISNSIKLSAKKSDLKSNFAANWLYGRQQEVLVNNDFSGTFDVNLYRTLPHFYYWAILSYNSSFSLKINHQVQTGLGIAYNLIEKKYLQLNISDGLIYDYTDLILDDTIRDINQTPRNSFRIQIKAWASDKLTFITTSYLQNSLRTASDVIIKSESTVQVRLKKWIALNMRFTYNKFSRTQKENFFITYGVILEQHF